MLCLAGLSCRERLTTVPPPPPEPRCGDAVINTDAEQCEGSDLNGATCQSLGFDTGTLSCTDACILSTTLCSKRCGNGALDPGEACDGALGVPACNDFGYVSCSPTCQLDRTHCTLTAFKAAPSLSLAYGGIATVGDLSPQGFADLVMVVPARARVETYPWTVERGFDTVAARKLDYSRQPGHAMPADLDGDGQQDIGVINLDGSIDRYRAGSSFALQPLPDAGVPALAWLGRASLSDGGESLIARTSEGFAVVRAGALAVAANHPLPSASQLALGDFNGDGVTDLGWCAGSSELGVAYGPSFAADAGTLSLPFTPTAFAFGDFDGDGDLDAVAADGTAIKVLENTGPAFAERQTLATQMPGSLSVADLDLDGRLDAFWEADGRAQLRRNQGAFSFAPFDFAVGTGASLGLLAADLDGDHDLDLICTHSAGGEATSTSVLINQVR